MDTNTPRPAKKQLANGIKALILASSIGMTLGGWGILAANQFANVPTIQATTTTVVQAAPVSVQSSKQAQTATQINATTPQFRAVTRTRSSR